MADNKTFLEKRVHSRIPVKIPVQYRQVEDPKELENLRGKTGLAKDVTAFMNVALEKRWLEIPE